MDFDTFSKAMSNAGDRIDLRKAVGTERKRGAKVRDKFVFGKVAWAEALTYISIIQSMIIFMALIPLAVISVNGMLEWIGIGWQFPIELASVSALIAIVCIFVFGLIAVRHIGTTRRAQEISAKMNPAFFLLWEQNEEIIKNQKKILKLKEE